MRTIWKLVSRTFVGLVTIAVAVALLMIPLGIAYHFAGFAGIVMAPILIMFCGPILYFTGRKIVDKEDFPSPGMID